MIEIGIIAIIVLAVGYWVTLWLMGRHDDVLHGDFVHPEGAEAAANSAPPASPFPTKPFPGGPFPAKPFPAKSLPAQSAAGKPVAANRLPRQASAEPSPRPDRSDTLQSLLASIKRDLKDASQL
jgi:hypothetical protein